VEGNRSWDLRRRQVLIWWAMSKGEIHLGVLIHFAKVEGRTRLVDGAGDLLESIPPEKSRCPSRSNVESAIAIESYVSYSRPDGN
jgi:hypothetical protein